MKIRQGEWTLFDYDPKLKRQVWYRENPDGSTTWKTDYEVTDTMEINLQQRLLAAANWKGDYHHIASIPLNIYHDQLAEASRQDDQKFINKWLNSSDNRAWRTKEGTL